MTNMGYAAKLGSSSSPSLEYEIGNNLKIDRGTTNTLNTKLNNISCANFIGKNDRSGPAFMIYIKDNNYDIINAYGSYYNNTMQYNESYYACYISNVSGGIITITGNSGWNILSTTYNYYIFNIK